MQGASVYSTEISHLQISWQKEAKCNAQLCSDSNLDCPVTILCSELNTYFYNYNTFLLKFQHVLCQSEYYLHLHAIMLLELPGVEVYVGGTAFLSSYMLMLGGIFPGNAGAYGLYGGG